MTTKAEAIDRFQHRTERPHREGQRDPQGEAIQRAGRGGALASTYDHLVTFLATRLVGAAMQP